MQNLERKKEAEIKNLPVSLLCTFLCFFSCLPSFSFLSLPFPSVFSSLRTFQCTLSLFVCSRHSTFSLRSLPQCGSWLRRSSLVECLPSGWTLTSGESNWLCRNCHQCLELCWIKAVLAKNKFFLIKKLNLYPFPFLKLSGMNLLQDF